MQRHIYKALFTGQRAGLLVVALMCCATRINASEHQLREAYFNANTGRALEVLTDFSLPSLAAFKWRDSTINVAYVRTVAGLNFDMQYSSVAKNNESKAGQRVRLVLAEKQIAEGDSSAALNTLNAGRYAKGFEQAQYQYLLGQAYVLSGKIEEAQRLYKKWKGSDPIQVYLSLNIGIWLAEQSRLDESAQWLTKAAAMQLPAGEEWSSLKDRANVYLGGVYNFLGKPALARKTLEKVRLSGMDANRALLSLGWTDVARTQNKEALAPWTYLSEQSHSDPSVQEAYLLVPFALGKLGAHGKASNTYAAAIEIYEQELELLNKVERQAQDGSLLKHIAKTHQKSKTQWQASLRQAVGPQLSVYLAEALKHEELYGLMNNYMQIEDMRKFAAKSLQRNNLPQSITSKMQSIQQAYAELINPHLQREITAQIQRLKEYQSHANFSLAESYERVANGSAWEQ